MTVRLTAPRGATESIRVSIADPQLLCLQGIAALLDSAPGISIVGTTSEAHDVPGLVRDSQPDVLVVDSKMAKLISDEHWQKLQKHVPALKTIVLADADCAARASASAPPETRGLVQRTESQESLLQAIKAVASGRTWEMPARRLTPSLNGKRPDRLSPREREIAILIAQGHGNREISKRLELSEQSVKNLVSRILKKQGFRNRVQIALWRLAEAQEV
jgi:DNA-binding NarL/FixJ family response regulator